MVDIHLDYCASSEAAVGSTFDQNFERKVPLSKQDVLVDIDREWRLLLEVAGGFSESEQLLPGAVGHWDVRESLLHVAAWDLELVGILEHFSRTGEQRDFGDGEAVDALNESQVEEKWDLTPEQVWGHLHTSHRTLVDYISGLPEETFNKDSYSGESIVAETANHYQEHREDMERFRASS